MSTVHAPAATAIPDERVVIPGHGANPRIVARCFAPDLPVRELVAAGHDGDQTCDFGNGSAGGGGVPAARGGGGAGLRGIGFCGDLRRLVRSHLLYRRGTDAARYLPQAMIRPIEEAHRDTHGNRYWILSGPAASAPSPPSQLGFQVIPS